MTLSQHISSAPILLLILYGAAQRLTIAIPVAVVSDAAVSDAAAVPETAVPWRGQAEVTEAWGKDRSLMQTPPQEEPLEVVDPRTLVVALLESLTKPVEKAGDRAGAERAILGILKQRHDNMVPPPADIKTSGPTDGQEQEAEKQLETGNQGQEQEQLMDMKSDGEEQLGKEEVEQGEEEEYKKQKGAMRSLETLLGKLQKHNIRAKEEGEVVLQREARGYFPNVDLGLQDNEILPPLKGYKLYNQELARAGKKLKWQEDKSRRTRPSYSHTNFMRDFEEEDNTDDDEEFLTREEEEARARAEQEEVRRQEAEAQRARAEEERLADIASDRVLQYMVKKQAAGYASQRRKAALATNAVEDKRSEEEEEDDDDIDPQTIDKLIEISSKLHLPADDVVDIISDVEEKKKRKDAPQTPPRYRPLVPPPVPASRYGTAAKSPSSISYTKWVKSKGKPWKQDFWSKPQKQFLAYPSYPFYQKPYRAYYPVYFSLPKAKPRYYSQSALTLDELLGNSRDHEFDIPKRRYRPWGHPRPRKWPTRLQGPYIPNYILPHPRTYLVPPIPKARSTARLRTSLYRSAPAAGPAVAQDNSYYDLTGQQQDSDEELENFIEKIYLKRRLF